MSKQGSAAEKITAKAQAKTPTTLTVAGAAELVAEPLAGAANPQQVGGHLGDPRLPAIQRQELAQRVGQAQGNGRLQRVMTELKSRQTAGSYQPHTTQLSIKGSRNRALTSAKRNPNLASSDGESGTELTQDTDLVGLGINDSLTRVISWEPPPDENDLAGELGASFGITSINWVMREPNGDEHEQEQRESIQSKRTDAQDGVNERNAVEGRLHDTSPILPQTEPGSMNGSTSPSAVNDSVMSSFQPAQLGETTLPTRSDTTNVGAAPPSSVPAVPTLPEADNEPSHNGGASALADAETLALPAIPEDIPDETSGLLAQFQQEVTRHRDHVRELGHQNKEQIRATAESQKVNVQVAIEVEAVRLESIYDQSIEQVHQATENVRIEIISNRDAKITAIGNTAQAEIANLQRLVSGNQTVIRNVAERKATEAEREGEAQAERALSHSRQKSDEAIAIGQRKTEQYKSYKRAARIGRVAQEIAAETSCKVLNAGNQLAATARKDSGDLAAKFRREANEAEAKFGGGLEPAQRKIIEGRDEAIRSLNQLVQEPITRLETAARDTITQLQTARQGAGQRIRLLTTVIIPTIDDGMSRACDKVDQETAEAISQLNNFAVEGTAHLSQVQGAITEQHAHAAQDELNTVLAEYDAGMNDFVGDVQQAFENAAIQATEQASAQVNQQAEPVQQTGSNFETNTDNASGRTVQAMGEVVSRATEGMHTVVVDMERELQNTVTQSDTAWERQLNEGKAGIKNKVDRGLAENDKLIAGLGVQIDQKAEEIEHESILSRTLRWIGGAILGFFKAFGELLLIILVVAIVVLLVVGLVILLAGGWEAVLAVVLAAAIYAAIYAETIALVLEIIGVLGAIIIIGMVIYNVYQAITREDLSDEERGELIGRAIFDIVTLFFGGKILTKLGQWIRRLIPRFRPPVISPPGVEPIPNEPGVPVRPNEPVRPGEPGRPEPGRPVEPGEPERPVAPGQYDPKARTDAELATDTDPTPRPGETVEQAQARAKAAEEEINLRQIVSTYEALGDEPRQIDLRAEDGIHQARGAHTTGPNGRHASDIPLNRGPGRTIEGRIYGDTPWGNRASSSTRWLSDKIMNDTVNQHLRANWEAIRSDLALNGRYENEFDAGKAVGEGFINKNMGGNGPPDALYIKTSQVRITIELIPGDPPSYFVVTTFPAYFPKN